MSGAQATYCHRVANGTWPDYRHTYDRECRAAFCPHCRKKVEVVDNE